MKKILAAILLCINGILVIAQNSIPLTWSAYTEVYTNIATNYSQARSSYPYIYNHHKMNQVSINYALLKASYSNTNTKGNIGLHAGTYVQSNYVLEPVALQHIAEANIGIKLSKRYDLWCDAGVMNSHIGYEGAIGIDNITLSRSLVADNSPYFETGAKLNYTSKNKKWYAALLLLNGWQNINRLNSGICIGSQITYTPHTKLKINYSNFAGYLNAVYFRHYHDVFAEYSGIKNLKLVGICDMGFDRINNNNFNWYTLVGMAQYTINPQWQAAVRAEHFNDPSKLIIANTTNKSLQSISGGIDYKPFAKVACRAECKQFIGTTEGTTNIRTQILLAMCAQL
jgi:hypothetical protein